ncbi:hypothetical protein AYO38_00380 [bacterium SCGC AG-212-C10]|nr:hypothetical protein AYO38_00380 [bacterium SCGC AG-212-C10]
MVDFVASDGLRLHVETAGPAEGPAVVLVHGLAGTTALQWTAPRIIERLAAEGVHVIAFDLRGHGKSDAPHDDSRYSDARCAQDLTDVTNAFAGSDAVVAGYSMGAAFTLLALEAGLQCKAAVVGAAAPAVLRWSDADRATRDVAVAALDRTGAPNPALDGWLAFLTAIGADRAAMAAVLKNHAPVVRDWSRIAVPVTVAAGAGDTMAAAPADIASRLANARVVSLPGDHISASATAEFLQAILDEVQR